MCGLLRQVRSILSRCYETSLLIRFTSQEGGKASQYIDRFTRASSRMRS